jgi:paraquat-inducible protein B
MITTAPKQHNHTPTHTRLPSAVIKKGRLTLLLWLVPFGAACLCAWFAWQDVISTGPTITMYFENADGVEVKNTDVKYRGANVGVVTGIVLTKDGRHVMVTAQLDRPARNLAHTGSVFWIVRPELKVGSISGLRTIISGEYIAVKPGDGPATNSFTGAETEPVSAPPGALEINLLATRLGSLEEQTPVSYRGVQVGEVLNYQLGGDGRGVVVHACVWKEYAPLVRMESKFWNAGELSLHAGLFRGIDISADSPRAIISGGIEFATPPDAQSPATNGATFVFNDTVEDKWKTWEPTGVTLHLPEEAPHSNSPPASIVQQMPLKGG